MGESNAIIQSLYLTEVMNVKRNKTEDRYYKPQSCPFVQIIYNNILLYYYDRCYYIIIIDNNNNVDIELA